MDERERAIRALLPMVRAIARRIHRLVPSVDVDDLVGEGSIGLIRAVDGFDPSYGVPLEHYARRLVLGKMLNGVRRMDPVSERARRSVRDMQRERYALAVQSGTVPTIAQMCVERPGLEAAVRQVHEAVPYSLDRPLPEGVDPPIDYASDPAIVASERWERSVVREMVAALPARQRSIVLLHYFAEESLRAIGRRMAISSQRASQIHLTAIRKLRKMHRVAPD
jgi:RNA polymerase sigma factor (sigma-70 family)